MKIFVIDDEEAVLREMVRTVEKAAGDAGIVPFTRCSDALNEVERGCRPDAVFTDIEMPGISGLEFAVKLKALSPDTRIIFVTAYEQYAIRAFKIKAHGYLLKPLRTEDVQDELKYCMEEPELKPAGDDDNRLQIHCFGHFEVYCHGKPVIFERNQTRELLAYLVDRRGAACTTGQIALALWEEDGGKGAVQQRIRNLISDLRKTLRDIGMEDLIIREHRHLAIRMEMTDCDYYRMLEGDMDALNSYHGEYMKDYSWAEITNAKLMK